MELDFLIISAHTDDAEIGMGATISKMVHQGARGLICDLTDGSMASSGSVESRQKEGLRAAEILGVQRRFLGISDTYLDSKNREQISRVVDLIREFKPRVLFVPQSDDYHPDHKEASELAKVAWYYSGLYKFDSQFPRFRPERVISYQGGKSVESPSFCIDVTGFEDEKMNVLSCFDSQLASESDLVEKKVVTAVNTPEYRMEIVKKMEYYGVVSKCKYAEPFWIEEEVCLDSPLDIKGKIYG